MAKKFRPEMKRSALIVAKVRPAERRALEALAHRIGTTVSTLVRTGALREVKRLQRQQQHGEAAAA